MNPSVQDQVATGTREILDSPHVSEGPGRVANAPVPSVFRDDRGEIHRLKVLGANKKNRDATSTNNKESTSTSATTGTLHSSTTTTRINIISSNADVMRSGYLHPIPKYVVVLSGQVEVWILTQTETVKTIYTAPTDSTDNNNSSHNFFVRIDPYTPHILHFLKDSVTAEWWDPSLQSTTQNDLQCWFYRPYRRIVDIQNNLVAPSTGYFQRLIPQDDFYNKRRDNNNDDDSNNSSSRGKWFWLVNGMVLGSLSTICVSALAVLWMEGHETPTTTSSNSRNNR